MIGQHLTYLEDGKPHLHYWIREGKANNAEVDYVVATGSRILPIEVKAGAGGSLKSIQQFILEKNVSQAVRFDLNPSSCVTAAYRARADQTASAVTFELLSLPLYAVEALPLATSTVDALSRSLSTTIETTIGTKIGERQRSGQ
jgi:hypothetical protein